VEFAELHDTDSDDSSLLATLRTTIHVQTQTAPCRHVTHWTSNILNTSLTHCSVSVTYRKTSAFITQNIINVIIFYKCVTMANFVSFLR